MYLFLTFLLAIFATGLNGYTISYLWSWFIVPVFGLPALSPAQAIGVALVVVYMTQRIAPEDLKKKTEEEENVELVRNFVIAFFRPAFALLFGKVVCQFL